MWRLIAVPAAIAVLLSVVAIVLIAIQIAQSLITIYGQEEVLIGALIGLGVGGVGLLVASFDL